MLDILFIWRHIAEEMASVGLLQIPEVEIPPPLEQEGNLCQASVEEIDKLLCGSHRSRAQSRRTVSFYVDITFFRSKLSKQGNVGKRMKYWIKYRIWSLVQPVPNKIKNSLL